MYKVNVCVTEAELQSHKACASGVDGFREVFPDGIDVAEWTPLHSVWLASSSLTDYAEWARENSILPSLSLRRADLRGANLFGAHLRGADLSGADLGGADLGGADLGGWGRGRDGYAKLKST